MAMANNNKMLQADKKQTENFKSQLDIKPKVETSNQTNTSVSKNTWLKLTGSAALGLGEVFLGSSVAVLQDREIKAQAPDTINSAPTGQEYIIKVSSYKSFMATPPGQGAEGGDAPEPGKGVTSRVEEREPLRIVIPGAAGTHKTIRVLKSNRIVLLGEAGAGKSSLGNNIFGENVFKINQTPKLCRSSECQLESKSIHGRRITLVDAPGFDDTDGPEPELKGEILKGITECAPGPHAFLIVLKIDNFTEQKKAVIDKICQLFSEEAFKYAAIVFTHGDQLPEGMNIEEFVHHNKCLSDLVKKCTSRYHFIDSRCGQDKDYNQRQILQLLHTIEKIVMENKGGCYTNKLLQDEKRETGNASAGNPSQGETDIKANNGAFRNTWIKLSGPAGNTVAEAFFGPAVGAVREMCGEKKEEKEDEAGPEDGKKRREATTESEADRNEFNTEEDKEIAKKVEAEPTNGERQARKKETDTEEAANKAKKEEASKETEGNVFKPEPNIKGKESGLGTIVAAAGSAVAAAGLIAAAAGSTAAAAGSTVAAAGLIAAAAGSTVAAAGLIAAAAESTVAAAESTVAAAESTVAAAESTVAAAESTAAGAESTVAAAGSTVAAAESTVAAAGSTAAAAGSTVAATGILTTAFKFTGAAAVAAVVAGVLWVLKLIIPKIKWFIEKIKQFLGLLTELKEHVGVVLLVVVFFLLLALAFCAKVPAASTIMLSVGILVMFLLIVVLFLII